MRAELVSLEARTPQTAQGSRHQICGSRHPDSPIIDTMAADQTPSKARWSWRPCRGCEIGSAEGGQRSGPATAKPGLPAAVVWPRRWDRQSCSRCWRCCSSCCAPAFAAGPCCGPWRGLLVHFPAASWRAVASERCASGSRQGAPPGTAFLFNVTIMKL